MCFKAKKLISSSFHCHLTEWLWGLNIFVKLVVHFSMFFFFPFFHEIKFHDTECAILFLTTSGGPFWLIFKMVSTDEVSYSGIELKWNPCECWWQAKSQSIISHFICKNLNKMWSFNSLYFVFHILYYFSSILLYLYLAFAMYLWVIVNIPNLQFFYFAFNNSQFRRVEVILKTFFLLSLQFRLKTSEVFVSLDWWQFLQMARRKDLLPYPLSTPKSHWQTEQNIPPPSLHLVILHCNKNYIAGNIITSINGRYMMWLSCKCHWIFFFSF